MVVTLDINPWLAALILTAVIWFAWCKLGRDVDHD